MWGSLRDDEPSGYPTSDTDAALCCLARFTAALAMTRSSCVSVPDALAPSLASSMSSLASTKSAVHCCASELLPAFVTHSNSASSASRSISRSATYISVADGRVEAASEGDVRAEAEERREDAADDGDSDSDHSRGVETPIPLAPRLDDAADAADDAGGTIADFASVGFAPCRERRVITADDVGERVSADVMDMRAVIVRATRGIRAARACVSVGWEDARSPDSAKKYV